MSIIRVEKKGDYTVMSNHHLRNPGLSLKAKGLLSLLLSNDDGWKITIEGLATTSIDGKDAIRTALEELTRAKYVTRTQRHGEDGTFSGFDYVVTEIPADAPLSENPIMDAPLSDFPTTENPTLRNTKYNNTPYSPPEGGKRERAKKEPKRAPEWMPDRFEKFWAAYPNGKAKQKAISAWDKLRADEETMTAMAAGLKKQLASEMWQRGIGIPYAATWLNQRRWEDEERGVSCPRYSPAEEEQEAMQEW